MHVHHGGAAAGAPLRARAAPGRRRAAARRALAVRRGRVTRLALDRHERPLQQAARTAAAGSTRGHRAERHLQEPAARARGTRRGRRCRRSGSAPRGPAAAAGPCAARAVGHLAGQLLAALDEGHAGQRAAEQLLHHGVVGAAEDDRVHRRPPPAARRTRAPCPRWPRSKGSPLWMAGARRGQATLVTRTPASLRVDHALVGAGATVASVASSPTRRFAGGLHGGVRLGPHHPDHRQVRCAAAARLERGGGGGVAGHDDQLDALAVEPARRWPARGGAARRGPCSPYGNQAVSPK